MCVYIPNMKFLCLILYQGEVCTDTNANTNDDDTGRQCTKHDYLRLWLINQMSQKFKGTCKLIRNLPPFFSFVLSFGGDFL